MDKQTISLYDWSVNIDFYADKHWYKIWNRFIPSVTGITWVLDKPALLYRAVNCYKDYLLKCETVTKEDIEKWSKEWRNVSQEAKDIWSIVHDYCEKFAKWEKLDIPEEEQARKWIMAFLDRQEKYQVKFLENERFIYSKEHDYCWKFDTLVEVKGKRYIVDFKTSKGFYPMEMGMQLAWYRMAYEEETGDKIDWSFIARFDKETGNFEVHWCNDYEQDRDAFIQCSKIRQRIKSLEKEYNNKL